MKIFQSFAGFMEKILPLLYSKLPNLLSASPTDLNDYTQDGFTFQSTIAGATMGLNYPKPTAGLLEVKANNTTQIFQTYSTYDNTGVFTRTRYNSLWNAWALQVSETRGTAVNSQKLNNLTADNFLTLGKTTTPIWNTGSAHVDGVFVSKTQNVWSAGTTHDWTQGVFHNNNQPQLLDNKTSWLTSINTQYSQGYSMMSKIGLHRHGYDYNGAFVFQHTGESNIPLGQWAMTRGGSFDTKHITMFKDIDGNTGEGDHSKLLFRRKQPQSTRQVLGSILWDSFRDVSDPSYVAGIWAEGMGTAANFGELHFGATQNGAASYPNTQMKVTHEGVEVLSQFTTTLMSTVSIKCRDVPTAIANQGRDWDGVSSILRWKNYGNGHTIMDASSGVATNGRAVSKTDAAEAWQSTYPMLVGDNGTSTFGVKVDRARVAETMLDGAFGVPVGMIMAWPTSYIPAGWLSLDGRSTAGYPILANIFGTNLPNYNGTAVEGGLFLSSSRQGRGADPHNAVSGKVGAHEHGIPFSNGGYLNYTAGGGLPGVNSLSASPSATSGGTSGNTYPTHIVVNWVVRAG